MQAVGTKSVSGRAGRGALQAICVPISKAVAFMLTQMQSGLDAECAGSRQLGGRIEMLGVEQKAV